MEAGVGADVVVLEDLQRGPVEAADDVGLLLYPRVVVGARAPKGVVEDPLLTQPDADRDRKLVPAASGDQGAADIPASSWVKRSRSVRARP